MKRKDIQNNNAVTAIAACITSPDKAGPVRYRDTLTGTKTATVNIQTMPQSDWPDVLTAAQRLAAGNFLVVLFRNVLRWFVLNLKSGVTGATQYNWYFDGLAVPSASTPIYNGTQQLPVCYADFFTGTAYHGNRLYHGRSSGKRFLWQDAGSITVVNDTALSATQTLTITIYTWNEGAPLPIGVLVWAPATAAGTAVTTGAGLVNYQYIALEANLEDTGAVPAPFNISVYQTTLANTECFSHQCMTGLIANQGRVQAARVLGSAYRVMNISPEQYKAGSWAAVQLTKGDRWTNYIQAGAAPFTLLTTLKNCASLLLAKGSYGYHKPTQTEDFDFRIPFENTYNVTQSVNGYEMDDSTSVLVALYAPQGVGTLSHALQFQFSINMEYQTEDQWVHTSIAETETDDWENALEVVSSMDQFYENPTHWAEIFRTIGKFARIGAPIASLFGGYGKAAGVGMSVVGSALAQI